MEHFTIIQYAVIIIALVVVGLFSGFIGSFFGVGGGTVLVPCFLVLYTLLHDNASVAMHQAVGTSLVLVVLNTFFAARRHHAVGNLSVSYFKRWAVWLSIGGIIGGLLIAFVSALFLKILFISYLVLAIAYGIFKRPEQSATPSKKKVKLPEGAVKIVAGIIFSGVSVLLGNAGGTFTTPFFTYFNYPIKKAMALSVAGGVVIGFIGSVAAILAGLSAPDRIPFSWGYVNILSVILVAPFIVLSSSWGVKAANKMSEYRLHWCYIAFLTALVIYMILNLVIHV